MKRFITMILLASLIGLMVGCQAETQSSDPLATDETITDQPAAINLIDAETAKNIMDESDDIIILDVRTPEEYSEGHIENALLLPLSSLQDSDFSLIPDKEAKILVYCRSGNRSNQAAQILVDNGYADINDFGGIMDWPYGTVTE